MAKEHLNMSDRNIRRYRKIADLIPEFQEKVFNGELSLLSAEKLATLDIEDQTLLYDKYNNDLNNDIIKQINKYMSINDILELIDNYLNNIQKDIPTYIELTVMLPKDQQDNFINEFNKWIKNNKIHAKIS